MPAASRRIYLDHALRSPLRPVASEFWKTIPHLPQGLPISPHRSGRRAADFLEKYRKEIITASDINPNSQIRFFSSFVTAAHSCLDAASLNSTNGARTILMSSVESSTTRYCVTSWAKIHDWNIREVPCDKYGFCPLTAWSDALKDGSSILVSCAAVGEVGSLQLGSELLTTAHASGACVVRDISPAFCWTQHTNELFSADYLFGSAMRLGAADFGAFAFFKTEPSLLIDPEPVSLAGAIAAVALHWQTSAAESVTKMRDARKKLEQELLSRLPEIIILGNQHEERRLPHVTCVRFPQVETEALSLVCDLKGVEFSSSPACVVQAAKESHILLAMGMSPAEAKETCTFGVDSETTIEDVCVAAEIISAGVQRIKRI